MDTGYIIEILTLEYSKLCYEKYLAILKIIFSIPFYVLLRKLRIAIMGVMQPSLYSFPLVFVFIFNKCSWPFPFGFHFGLYTVTAKISSSHSLKDVLSELITLSVGLFFINDHYNNSGTWDSNTVLVCCWQNSHQWARASSFTRFLDHTQRRTIGGRTPLYE
jgi:hypothetical protein